jgi:hypothetical protein
VQFANEIVLGQLLREQTSGPADQMMQKVFKVKLFASEGGSLSLYDIVRIPSAELPEKRFKYQSKQCQSII